MTEASATVRVLVADDDGEGRALLVTILSSLGHDVVAEAANGHDAVASAEAVTPDAVLLDVHMPDGSGIDAAKAIAAKLPGTAVLLFTGDETLQLSDRDVAETSAITILPKPTPQTLLDSALRLGVARARGLTAARDAASKATQDLEERKLIERAKGILMRRGVTEQVAYEIMRRQSQDKSVRMVDIAREILRTDPAYEERVRKPPAA